MRFRSAVLTAATIGAALVSLKGEAQASSHREAPFVSKNPKTDASDFYMFQSYTAGNGVTIDGTSGASNYTTIIANYEPLQDPAGGPNFYPLDQNALYEIKIDNNGDAVEDLTFQFQFQNQLTNAGAGLELPIGPDGGAIDPPFINLGDVRTSYANGLLVTGPTTMQSAETYTVGVVNGPARAGTPALLTDGDNAGSTTFYKPVDNIGFKSYSTPATTAAPANTNYAAYASSFVRKNVTMAGCASPVHVFVGQRQEGFSVELGVIFDLINANKADIAQMSGNTEDANTKAASNIMNSKNVTSIALEVPTSCLLAAAGSIDGGLATSATTIGGWTTASVRQARVINPNATYDSPSVEGGPWAEVSRLGMPLVNEVVIGLKDKDRFNSSSPSGDGQFLNYVTNPSLAAVIDVLFGPGLAPTVEGRPDLVAAFLTGVPGVNQTSSLTTGSTFGAPAEYVRLNTALPVTQPAKQNHLGAAACFVDKAGNGAVKALDTTAANTSPTGCDVAGFPNGRRPGDDIVDIELRVMEGYLYNIDVAAQAPARTVAFTDTALQTASQFTTAGFPYLNTPYAGDDNTLPHAQ